MNKMTNEIINDDFILKIWLKSLEYKAVYLPLLILFPIGIVLNSVSILLFARNKFKNENYGFLNIISCVVFNIMAALVLAMSILMLIRLESTAYVLLYFLFNFFNEFPSWLNLIIAIDKILSLKRADAHLNVKNKKLTLYFILCTIFFVILCSHIPKFKSIVFGNKKKISIGINQNVSQNYNYFLNNATIIEVDDYEVILRMLVPSLLILMANIIFVIKLIKLKTHYRVINDRFMEKKLDIIFSIVSVDLIYMLALALKIAFFFVFLFGNDGIINLDNQNSIVYVYSYIYISFFNIIMNFFVYISVCMHFRNEFKKVFSPRIKKIKVIRVRNHFTFIIYLNN
jgi:hypothetical protein